MIDKVMTSSNFICLSKLLELLINPSSVSDGGVLVKILLIAFGSRLYFLKFFILIWEGLRWIASLASDTSISALWIFEALLFFFLFSGSFSLTDSNKMELFLWEVEWLGLLLWSIDLEKDFSIKEHLNFSEFLLSRMRSLVLLK